MLFRSAMINARMTSIDLDVSYSQIAVFMSGLEKPFNMWTDHHVRQGFSWRPESVAFRTIEEAGQHMVELICSDVEVSNDAVRVIQTPFEVSQDGWIEVASISESKSFKIPSGKYALRFECFPRVGSKIPRIRLLFSTQDNALFRVIRADPEISKTDDLLVSPASPA